MSYELVEKLKADILAYEGDKALSEVGLVTETGDGIVKISGLPGALSQEELLIETAGGTTVSALVFNLEEHFIGGIVLGESQAVAVGDRVRSTGRVLSLPVGEGLLGRVIDSLGRPLDGAGVLADLSGEYPLEKTAPGVLEREGVRVPLHTGIKAIDAMIPIGRGQRELIIGDRGTGKTAIALDTIINQKQDPGRPPVVCVYVAIGQKNAKVAQTVKLLAEHEALGYTIVVNAPASSAASLQYLAPFAGCAIGEYFMDQGRDVLVIFDDLSKHANAYRELSLLLRRPPGREAYPGDVFYLHSRLLERSAKLSAARGGGSLTALPIIETQLGDVAAYVPTNVISITDGQIYLESQLFNQGVRPAINVGLSVSRVGSAAQTKAMKKVAGRLRLDLAQFRELQAFVQFASDLDEATKKKIERGQLLTEVLKQMDANPLPFEAEVAILFVAVGGWLDPVPVGEIKQIAEHYLTHLRAVSPVTLEAIKTTGELSATGEEELKKAVESTIASLPKALAN